MSTLPSSHVPPKTLYSLMQDRAVSHDRRRKEKARGSFLMLSALVPGAGCFSLAHHAILICPHLGHASSSELELQWFSGLDLNRGFHAWLVDGAFPAEESSATQPLLPAPVPVLVAIQRLHSPRSPLYLPSVLPRLFHGYPGHWSHPEPLSGPQWPPVS
ncbi:hypothetical protein P7K49_036568 [Saguinus oedipus]|uniref:Uncharacterized protein n=1 Tax=Saguinus oedipus TaxID=9490 RepID=A0ABQ9TLG2_SAGOE|nr:hypothetical protein P7K49_036568 [Saguinus oedipus]